MRWLVSGKEITADVRRGHRIVSIDLEPGPTQLLAEARGRVASLASTYETEPTKPLESCPNGSDRVIVELFSGSVYPDRCRSSQCRFCLPLNARRRALAITLAGPQRMIRLSLLAGESDANPCTTARKRVALIRRNLKRMGREPGEWSFTIERNPKETGYHAHCLQRGRWIPQAELQESCVRAGAGFPHINSIKREGQWTARYGLKGFGADGYGLKGFRANGDPTDALRINNRRLEHHSTRFFTIDGEKFTPRQMESMAIAQMNEGKQIAFVGCHPDYLPRLLGDSGLRFRLIRDTLQRTTRNLRALV